MEAKRIAALMSRPASWEEGEAARALQAGLAERGHDVTFVVMRTGDEDVEFFPDSTVIALDGAGGQPRRSLGQALRQIDPDVVITLDAAAHVPGQWGAWRAGIGRRIAAHLLSGPSASPVHRIGDLLAGSFGLYTTVVTPSHAQFDAFGNHPRSYRKRIHVIAPGLTVRVDERTRKDARRDLDLPAGGRITMACGPFTAERSLAIPIAALEACPKVLLILAGDGPDRAQLEAQIRAARLASRVRLVPMGDERRLRALMRASDLYLDAGAADATSVARMTTAMATGLPIIASDTPAHVELLSDAAGHRAGLLVPTGQRADAPALWARAMGELLGEVHLRHRLGRAAVQRAAEFSAGRMAERYERLFASAPHKAAAPPAKIDESP
ncbi:MAG: glycosyltransferase family 4 protein [Alphaproteobacteria bacterium]